MMKSASMANMTQGKPIGLLLRFAVPMLIGNLFQQAYNLVDSLVVGNFVGTQALAAVSIANYPNRVLLALFVGLGMGGTIRIAQHTGANNLDGARKVIQTANGLIQLVSLPLTAIGLLLSGPVLSLMRTPPDAFADANAYLSILFLGTLPLLGFNLNAGILRGLGDSRSPVLFLLVATVTNIVLDLLFVAVFGWGVVGAAVATVIAMGVAWGFSLVFIHRKYPQYRAPLWPLRIDREALSDIFRLGLPIGLNDALFSLGHLTLSSIVNTHGSAFAAGYSVGNKIDSLSFMPLTSFASATTTYTGQNIGAGNLSRVQKGAKAALLLALSWAVIGCTVMLTLGRPLIGVFNKEAAVIETGYAYILRLEPFYWIYVVFFILNAVMNGAGVVRVPMIANLILFWGVRLPAAYLLTRFAAPNDLFFCFPISWAAGLLVSGPYFLTGRWKRRIRKEEAACEASP